MFHRTMRPRRPPLHPPRRIRRTQQARAQAARTRVRAPPLLPPHPSMRMAMVLQRISTAMTKTHASIPTRSRCVTGSTTTVMESSTRRHLREHPCGTEMQTPTAMAVRRVGRPAMRPVMSGPWSVWTATTPTATFILARKRSVTVWTPTVTVRKAKALLHGSPAMALRPRM